MNTTQTQMGDGLTSEDIVNAIFYRGGELFSYMENEPLLQNNTIEPNVIYLTDHTGKVFSIKVEVEN